MNFDRTLITAFIYGQIELYKIEFANTGDRKYLEVMNGLSKTLDLLYQDEKIIKQLKNEIQNSRTKNT